MSPTRAGSAPSDPRAASSRDWRRRSDEQLSQTSHHRPAAKTAQRATRRRATSRRPMPPQPPYSQGRFVVPLMLVDYAFVRAPTRVEGVSSRARILGPRIPG